MEGGSGTLHYGGSRRGRGVKEKKKSEQRGHFGVTEGGNSHFPRQIIDHRKNPQKKEEEGLEQTTPKKKRTYPAQKPERNCGPKVLNRGGGERNLYRYGPAH